MTDGVRHSSSLSVSISLLLFPHMQTFVHHTMTHRGAGARSSNARWHPYTPPCSASSASGSSCSTASNYASSRVSQSQSSSSSSSSSSQQESYLITPVFHLLCRSLHPARPCQNRPCRESLGQVALFQRVRLVRLRAILGQTRMMIVKYSGD